jgi:hypothetical protein
MRRIRNVTSRRRYVIIVRWQITDENYREASSVWAPTSGTKLKKWGESYISLAGDDPGKLTSKPHVCRWHRALIKAVDLR